jgi:hypothetical protein
VVGCNVYCSSYVMRLVADSHLWLLRPGLLPNLKKKRTTAYVFLASLSLFAIVSVYLSGFSMHIYDGHVAMYSYHVSASKVYRDPLCFI